MPVTVKKSKGAKPFKIVEKATGRKVGESDTKGKAEASARIRNAKTAEKTGKKAKK